MLIDESSFLWQYLSEGQKGLITVGIHLLEDVKNHPEITVDDYSYIVFPFAKAYEGFLKQIFLDLQCINEREYFSTHFRIGRALNPHLERALRHQSVFDKIIRKCNNRELAEKLWDTWREGRNLVFHYFPHNLRALPIEEAERLVQMILSTMEEAVTVCPIPKK